MIYDPLVKICYNQNKEKEIFGSPLQPALRAVVLNVNFCDERYSITGQSYTLSGVFIFCGGRYKLAKLTQTYQTKALKKYFRKPTWLNPFCSILTIGLTSGRKNNRRS